MSISIEQILLAVTFQNWRLNFEVFGKIVFDDIYFPKTKYIETYRKGVPLFQKAWNPPKESIVSMKLPSVCTRRNKQNIIR